jgi:glycerol-3-phosphate cytidylyltransferase-like family protein
VKASGLAEKVVLGEHGDKYNVLRKYKPDVIALGYDQFTFTFRLEKFLIDHKMNTKIVRMNPYRPTVFKTSLLRASTPQTYVAKSL